MPRYVLSSTSRSPKHEKLVKKLVQEFTASSPNLQPLILEEHVAPTRSRHVHVIWDAWKDVADEQRSVIIMEAYQQAEGEEVAREVTIAEGVTPQEALALGLLPFKVVPTRKCDDRHSPEDYQKARAEEARHTLLGSKAKELRYARLEDAEAASKRLEQALPGSSWAVVQEVVQES
jgi:hypothetical protein